MRQILLTALLGGWATAPVADTVDALVPVFSGTWGTLTSCQAEGSITITADQVFNDTLQCAVSGARVIEEGDGLELTLSDCSGSGMIRPGGTLELTIDSGHSSIIILGTLSDAFVTGNSLEPLNKCR